MGLLLDTIRKAPGSQPTSRFALPTDQPAESLVDFEVPSVAEPSTQKVQTLKETVEGFKTGQYQAGSLLKTIGGLAYAIPKYGARAALQTGLEIPYFKRTVGQINPEEDFGPLGKKILGEEPVVPFSEKYAEYKGAAESLGAGKFAPVVAGFAAGGEGALDLWFGGGAGKQAYKSFVSKIVKEVNPEVIVQDLIKKGVAEDIAKAFSTKLAETKSAKVVEEGLERIAKFQLETKAVTKATEPFTKEVKQIPEQLDFLIKKAQSLPEKEFISQFEVGLKAKNLTVRETAQNVEKILKESGFDTPKDFYNQVVKSTVRSVEEIKVAILDNTKEIEKFTGRSVEKTYSPLSKDKIVPRSSLPKEVKDLVNQRETLRQELNRAKEGVVTPKETSISSETNLEAQAKQPIVEPLNKLPQQDEVKSLSNIISEAPKKSTDKERGFITSIKESPQINEEIKSAVEGTYTPITNKETMARAVNLVSTDPQKALVQLSEGKMDADYTATALALINKYQAEGRIADAVIIAEQAAEKLTQGGQFIQAASMLNKLTPEGVLIHAQRRFAKAGGQKLKAAVNEVTQKFKQAEERAKDIVSKEASREGKAISEKVSVRAKKLPTPEEVAQKLAKRVSIKEPGDIKPDPIRDMVNTLYKVAQEFLPAKKKSVPKDPLELISKSIQEREAYREVWDQAQQIVKQKYAGDEATLELLDDYFETFLETPFSKKQVDEATRLAIKKQDIDLGKLVREHFSVVEKERGSLIEKMIVEAGIPMDQAQNLGSKIEARFDRLVKARKESELKTIFKERSQTDKALSDRIIELSNLGAFDDPNYRSLIAQKLKLPALTEDLATKLTKQAEKIQTMPPGYYKFRETQEMMKMIQNQIPISKTDYLVEFINIPRTLMSSFFDLSFGFRQGLFLIPTFRKEFKNAFTKQFKMFVREKGYEQVMDEVIKNPDFQLAESAGLAFTDVAGGLNVVEERYMATALLEKIPGLGQGVRATARAYTGMANKMRMDIFSTMVKDAERLGLNPKSNKELLENIASFVNHGTGRGSIKGLERDAQVTNAIFFSPRLIY